MAASDLIGRVDFVLKKKYKTQTKPPKFKSRFIAIRPFAKTLDIFATQEAFEFDQEPMIRIDLMSVFSIRIDVNGYIQITAQEAYYAIKPEDETAAERWLRLFKKNSLTNSSRMTSGIGKMFYDLIPKQLTEYVEGFCPGTNTVHVTRFIASGVDLIKDIYSRPEDNWNRTSSIFETLDEEVVSLIWLMMGKAGIYVQQLQMSSSDFQQGELYTSGVFRVDDNDGRIFKFLNSHRNVYHRISTHYSERIDETYALHEEQRGLDIRGGEGCALPAGKNTVLFFRLGDGTTILKIEKAGCPPFWSEGFRSTKNAMEFGRHSTDYFRSRVHGLTQGQMQRRDENCTSDFIQTFADALDILYPDIAALEKIKTDKDLDRKDKEKRKAERENKKVEKENSDIKRKIFKIGISAGLTGMVALLEAHLKEAEDSWAEKLAAERLTFSSNFEDTQNSELGLFKQPSIRATGDTTENLFKKKSSVALQPERRLIKKGSTVGDSSVENERKLLKKGSTVGESSVGAERKLLKKGSTVGNSSIEAEDRMLHQKGPTIGDSSVETERKLLKKGSTVGDSCAETERKLLKKGSTVLNSNLETEHQAKTLSKKLIAADMNYAEPQHHENAPSKLSTRHKFAHSKAPIKKKEDAIPVNQSGEAESITQSSESITKETASDEFENAKDLRISLKTISNIFGTEQKDEQIANIHNSETKIEESKKDSPPRRPETRPPDRPTSPPGATERPTSPPGAISNPLPAAISNREKLRALTAGAQGIGDETKDRDKIRVLTGIDDDKRVKSDKRDSKKDKSKEKLREKQEKKEEKERAKLAKEENASPSSSGSKRRDKKAYDETEESIGFRRKEDSSRKTFRETKDDSEEVTSSTQAEITSLIENELSPSDMYPKILDHVKKLRELVEIDIRRGYRGERRGWEVCLPNPTQWHELNGALSDLPKSPNIQLYNAAEEATPKRLERKNRFNSFQFLEPTSGGHTMILPKDTEQESGVAPPLPATEPPPLPHGPPPAYRPPSHQFSNTSS